MAHHNHTRFCLEDKETTWAWIFVIRHESKQFWTALKTPHAIPFSYDLETRSVGRMVLRDCRLWRCTLPWPRLIKRN